MSAHHIVIIGSGPAGLAAAAALVDRGLDVTLVAPKPGRSWVPRYGAWLDELTAAGFEDCVAQSWSKPVVFTADNRYDLGVAYAHVDGDKLQRRLLDRCRAGDVRILDDRVRRIDVRDGDRRRDVLLASGSTLEAAVVVDASGAQSPFVQRTGQATAAQTAFGLDIEVDGHPWAEDEMLFMDFRGTGDPATFLYAQPASPTRVFVEETSLAAGPPIALALLESRLYERLNDLGIRIREVHGSERCWIPLDVPMPDKAQLVVPFGAAAAFTHPATGYTLVRTLTAAAPMAEAIEVGLESSPEAAVSAAMDAIWPTSARMAREAHLFGLRVLLGLDAEQHRSWFDTFFTLSEDRWRAMLAPGGAPSAVLGSMGAMAMRAPKMVAEAVYNRDMPKRLPIALTLPETP